MPRVYRAELLYVGACVALLIIAVSDGGDHVWPYLTLAVALLPAGLYGVFLLALVAGGLPGPVGGGVMVIGVVVLAALNIMLARTLRVACHLRRGERTRPALSPSP